METLSSLKTQSWLVWFIRGLLLLGFLILLARLSDLQIIRGAYFRSLSEENRIRRIPIIAPRGDILARGGEVLVGNKATDKKILDTTGEGFQKVESEDYIKNEGVITEWVRDYKLGDKFGHISGYIGEVNSEELGKIRGKCPEKGPRKLGGIVGRSGLEAYYECELSGTDGEELIEVDAHGKKIRELGIKEPVKGTSIKTTIDMGLQEKVATLMGDRKGAVVASDGHGQILALFSSPGFDPNILAGEFSSDKKREIIEGKNFPLFNRAIGGMFHPGSIFKPVVATAALQEGKIDKNFTYDDTGQIVITSQYGNFSYKNWFFTQYGGTEGNINLVRAITRSTDTFFYKVGELTGPDNLSKWASNFGLNEKTGIDLPGEVPGLVPNPEWKLKTKGERWFLGNTYHMSIGQGDLALTPIGMNIAISALANGGQLCHPHILNADALPAETCTDLGIKKENINLIKDGMRGACSPGGTGYTFFDFKEKSGTDVACKTGTAQNETGEPHAWFTIFAPVESPQIVLTVLVEKGGEGSKVAGPIARDIFNYWFKVQNSPTITPTPNAEKTSN